MTKSTFFIILGASMFILAFLLQVIWVYGQTETNQTSTTNQTTNQLLKQILDQQKLQTKLRQDSAIVIARDLQKILVQLQSPPRFPPIPRGSMLVPCNSAQLPLMQPQFGPCKPTFVHGLNQTLCMPPISFNTSRNVQ